MRYVYIFVALALVVCATVYWLRETPGKPNITSENESSETFTIPTEVSGTPCFGEGSIFVDKDVYLKCTDGKWVRYYPGTPDDVKG